MQNRNKGITLIALIITIIILLILVGVSINLAIKGDLFGSAEKAVSGTNDKTAQEQTRVDELMGEGIDPGYAITGYSIIDYVGNKFKLIDSGAVLTKAGVSFPLRLTKIFDDISMIIDEYKPDAISVEELFFNNNQKTAINVAQARGIILTVGCKKNVPTYEYTPLQIKQAVAGYGRADKIQVQKMVKTILNVENLPKLDDTTDSMAAAICHAHSAKFSQKL